MVTTFTKKITWHKREEIVVFEVFCKQGSNFAVKSKSCRDQGCMALTKLRNKGVFPGISQLIHKSTRKPAVHFVFQRIRFCDRSRSGPISRWSRLRVPRIHIVRLSELMKIQIDFFAHFA